MLLPAFPFTMEKEIHGALKISSEGKLELQGSGRF